jgi:hypothetical protein
MNFSTGTSLSQREMWFSSQGLTGVFRQADETFTAHSTHTRSQSINVFGSKFISTLTQRLNLHLVTSGLSNLDFVKWLNFHLVLLPKLSSLHSRGLKTKTVHLLDNIFLSLSSILDNRLFKACDRTTQKTRPKISLLAVYCCLFIQRCLVMLFTIGL